MKRRRMLPNPLLLEYTDSSLLEELIDFSCHSDINSMVGDSVKRGTFCDGKGVTLPLVVIHLVSYCVVQVQKIDI